VQAAFALDDGGRYVGRPSVFKERVDPVSASDNDRAGDLLIQEVDDELRHEQYQKLWARYGVHAAAVAIALVLFVAGYEGWSSWQNKVRQQDAAQFSAAQTLAATGKTTEAMEALAKLAADSHTGYGLAAGMRRAELLAEKGDVAAAAAAYDQIAASSSNSGIYRDLAVIKGALLEVETGDPAQLEKRLGNLTSAGNPWRVEATEILAMLAQKKGDTKRAAELYKQLADDATAPQGVRARAAEMLATFGPATDKAKG
jgi:hypothetical protein